MGVTVDRLNNLHDKLCQVLEMYINGRFIDPKTGEPMPPPPAILETTRKFLHDNGIEGVPVEGSPLNSLASLPMIDPDAKNPVMLPPPDLTGEE